MFGSVIRCGWRVVRFADTKNSAQNSNCTLLLGDEFIEKLVKRKIALLN
jgi:hypothetical protein